jgi:hypothetical protein
VTAVFPSGRGTAVQFKVGTRCVSCHVDVHRGALGDDCGRCHRPAPLAALLFLRGLPSVIRSGVRP